MVFDPVDPTDHPAREGVLASAFRLDVQRVFRPGWLAGAVPDTEMRAQFVARPAASWAEAVAKTGFLLERFGRTAEGQDARMQTLIRRALSDLTRLVQREADRK
jgi:hypothetical protein